MVQTFKLILLCPFQIFIIIMGSLKGTGRVTVMIMMVGWVSAQAGGHYTVVAPDTVRPNTNYLASISVDGTGGDLQVGYKYYRRLWLERS